MDVVGVDVVGVVGVLFGAGGGGRRRKRRVSSARKAERAEMSISFYDTTRARWGTHFVGINLDAGRVVCDNVVVPVEVLVLRHL